MSGDRTSFATLSIGGASLTVASCRVDERASAVTTVAADCASNDDIGVGGLVGSEATLTLHEDGAPTRAITLVVAEGGFRNIENGALRFDLTLHSPFWRLRHTRNIRKFRNLSAKDIISKVLSEGGIAHRWQILREPPVRKFCTQYRESNFHFVLRLLAFEGIYFTAEDDGSLLLSDASASAPAVAGKAAYPLLEHAGALEGETGIHAFGLGARVRTGKISVNDYNWKTPAVSLLASTAADRDAELEAYDYPAGFRKPGDGTDLAARRLEAHRCDAVFVTGRGNVTTFRPGHRFQYTGGRSGEYFLTSVTHVCRDPRFDDPAAEELFTYYNEFEAIPASVVFRPPAEAPRPVVQGAHTVTVVGPPGEEIHTDRFGRFRARFHWDREATGTDEDSRWLRKVQESGTGANLARVGWEVSVGYVDGDPDRPIGLARNINGVMIPAYGQPAEKHTMTIKTPSYPQNGGYNELKFIDRAGAMMMHWRAQKNLFNKVELDKTEDVRRDERHTVEVRFGRAVDRDQKIEIGGDRTTWVGTNRNTTVKGSRTDQIAGNETVRSDNNITSTVEGNDVESVGGMRLTLAGSIKPPDIASKAKDLFASSQGTFPGGGGGIAGALGGGGGIAGALGGGGAGGLGGALSFPSPSNLLPAGPPSIGALTGGLTSLLTGNIGRTGENLFSEAVGGAKISVSASDVQEEARFAFVEAVGGAKISIAGRALSQSVGGPNVHLVGAADFRTSDEDMGIAAENTTVMVGGAIRVSTDEKLELHGATITLRASETLKLAVGDDLAIEMTPDLIAFVGPLILTADDKVSFVAPEEHDLTGDAE